MRSINFLLTYLLTVGLAWHWRCVTDFSGLTTSRLKPHEREMSIPRVLQWSIAPFTLPVFWMLCRCRCHSSNSKMSLCLAVDICVVQTRICQAEYCGVSWAIFLITWLVKSCIVAHWDSLTQSLVNFNCQLTNPLSSTAIGWCCVTRSY